MTRSEKVKKVAGIIKREVIPMGGISNEEAIVLAFKIVKALEETPSKIEVKPDAGT